MASVGSVRVGTRLKRTRRSDIVFGRSGVLPSTGSSATIPVSGLAWRKLRTWRRELPGAAPQFL